MTALAPPDLRPMEMEKRRPPFATRSNVSRRCGRRRKFPLAFNGVVNARTFGLSFVSTRLFQNGQGHQIAARQHPEIDIIQYISVRRSPEPLVGVRENCWHAVSADKSDANMPLTGPEIRAAPESSGFSIARAMSPRWGATSLVLSFTPRALRPSRWPARQAFHAHCRDCSGSAATPRSCQLAVTDLSRETALSDECLTTRSKSASTISLISASSGIRGSQPSVFRALEESPSKTSTSAGR